MKHILRLLEIITLIVWFGAVTLACTGSDIKYIIGIVGITTGIWLIVAGYLTFIKDKKQ